MRTHSRWAERPRRRPAPLVIALLFASAEARAQDWSTPQPIENEPGDVLRSDLAVAPGGDAMAVWEQSDETRTNIWASRYAAATLSWGPPQLIEAVSTGDAQFPRVALSANGSAAAVWQQTDGNRRHVFANRFVPGTGWGAARRIQSGLSTSFLPNVAIDAHGFAIAVWTQLDSETINSPISLFAAHSIGEHWTAPRVLENTSMAADPPDIAIDQFDNALVVWAQNESNRSSIHSVRFEWFTQTWSAPVPVSANATGIFSFDPVIAMNASGAAVALWRQQIVASVTIVASDYQDQIAAPGVWSAPRQISAPCAAGNGSLVRADMNPAGDALGVWAQCGDAQAVRHSARTWGAAQSIEFGQGLAAGPAITIDPNGNGTAAWMQDDDSDFIFDLHAARFTPATGWSPGKAIEFETGSAFNPHVGADATGTVQAIWIQRDGAGALSLMSSRFGP